MSGPPITSLVARAHWHHGMQCYADVNDEIDERGDEEWHEPATCWNCGGEGFTIACCDDICHGLGYCMHGPNGHAECHICQGEGQL